MTDTEREKKATEYAESFRLGIAQNVTTAPESVKYTLGLAGERGFLAGYDAASARVKELEAENERLKRHAGNLPESIAAAQERDRLTALVDELTGTLEEIAKPPYSDSNIASLYEWCRTRAAYTLARIKGGG